MLACLPENSQMSTAVNARLDTLEALLDALDLLDSNHSIALTAAELDELTAATEGAHQLLTRIARSTIKYVP